MRTTSSPAHPDPGSQAARPGLGSAIRVLQTRPFRRYLIGQLVSNIGTWMQRAAQDLLILQLTGNSGASLGILTALQFLPQTLFGLYGGILADRYPKRRLLLLTQTLMCLQSLLLGVLTLTGMVNVWQLYALAFTLGTATALDSPARNAFVTEMVACEQVPSAVSLTAAQYNIARTLGPAAAGVAVAIAGTGIVFLLNAASYLAVLAALITMRANHLHTSTRSKRNKGTLTDALRHVGARPRLLLPITLIGLVGTFGFNFQVSMALMATTVFHSGAAVFGYLSAAYAAGSLLGALCGASQGTAPTARRLIVSTIVFGILEGIAGLSPGYPIFMALLLSTGLAAVTVLTTANAMIQLNADSRMRGRVTSIYLLVLLGGSPIGAPLAGLVCDTLGARYILILGGLICALGAIALAVAMKARSRRPRTRVVTWLNGAAIRRPAPATRLDTDRPHKHLGGPRPANVAISASSIIGTATRSLTVPRGLHRGRRAWRAGTGRPRPPGSTAGRPSARRRSCRPGWGQRRASAHPPSSPTGPPGTTTYSAPYSSMKTSRCSASRRRAVASFSGLRRTSDQPERSPLFGQRDPDGAAHVLRLRTHRRRGRDGGSLRRQRDNGAAEYQFAQDPSTHHRNPGHCRAGSDRWTAIGAQIRGSRDLWVRAGHHRRRRQALT
ncbi:MFS transporter [Nonomuraea sp. NPDC049784]|uniref:MFS transporter n=1 Tax=Nonomuraea sp. NPDC049784 TaxID=3154361 RepID=UPI003400537B